MSTIFGEVPYPIRSDLDEATRKAWEYLGQPGSWWTGSERAAFVAEVRVARDCRLCADRVDALSPISVQGEHDTASDLPAVAIEATHRLTNDAARLSEKTIREWNAAGLTDGAYVEIVSIVSTVMGIDAFCDALEIPLLPVPQAEPGEPSRYLPVKAVDDGAWVRMIPPDGVGESDAGLYDRIPGPRVPNVIRAMSLVPDAVRNLLDLLLPFYLGNLVHPEAGNSLDLGQIELVAARVSAVNECFYWTTAHTHRLRESSEDSDLELGAITKGPSEEMTGVPYGNELIAHADAVVARSPDVTPSRDAVQKLLGDAGVIATAAVISNFQRMVRIADGIGIQIDKGLELVSAEFRDEIGINRFPSAVGRGKGGE